MSSNNNEKIIESICDAIELKPIEDFSSLAKQLILLDKDIKDLLFAENIDTYSKEILSEQFKRSLELFIIQSIISGNFNEYKSSWINTINTWEKTIKELIELQKNIYNKIPSFINENSSLSDVTEAIDELRTLSTTNSKSLCDIIKQLNELIDLNIGEINLEFQSKILIKLDELIKLNTTNSDNSESQSNLAQPTNTLISSLIETITSLINTIQNNSVNLNETFSSDTNYPNKQSLPNDNYILDQKTIQSLCDEIIVPTAYLGPEHNKEISHKKKLIKSTFTGLTDLFFLEENIEKAISKLDIDENSRNTLIEKFNRYLDVFITKIDITENQEKITSQLLSLNRKTYDLIKIINQLGNRINSNLSKKPNYSFTYKHLTSSVEINNRDRTVTINGVFKNKEETIINRIEYIVFYLDGIENKRIETERIESAYDYEKRVRHNYEIKTFLSLFSNYYGSKGWEMFDSPQYDSEQKRYSCIIKKTTHN